MENDDHREAAVQALVALNAEGFPTLRRGLNHPRPEIREAVALAALELGSDAEALLPELLKLLEDKTDFVQEAAIETLGELRISSPKVLAALERRLASANDYEAAAAVRAFTLIGIAPKTVKPKLANLASKHRDPWVRICAIEALIAVGDPVEIKPVLTSALQDNGGVLAFMGSSSVNGTAADGLAQLAHRKTSGEIAKGLGDQAQRLPVLLADNNPESSWNDYNDRFLADVLVDLGPTTMRDYAKELFAELEGTGID